jgi:hypothetical protein
MATAEERFWRKVAKGERCWEWTAYRAQNGYGQFGAVAGESPRLAHRFAYELLVGPIPSGLVIDHLCQNKGCVNPAHMRVVTQRENVMRSDALTAINARKSHCIRGHPFDEVNTYWKRDGRRECIACRK